MRYLVAALLACSIGSAGAATFNVTGTTDTADGACDADCSFREAVIAANAAAGDDEIVLPAGTFELSRDAADGAPFATVTITDGNAGAPDALTIRGAGMAATIIEQTVVPAGVLHVAGDLRELVIEDLTLRGGLGEDGACLRTFAPTTVERVTFTDCHGDDDGGALMSFASLAVRHGVFVQNSATDDGGALMTFEPATITDTTFRDNVAFDAAGAIMPFAPLTLERVTFEGNRAGGGGGAMMTFAPVTATNCTFSGNEAGAVFATGASVGLGAAVTGAGGAIHAFEPIRLVHATVTGNKAVDAAGGVFNAFRLSTDDATVAPSGVAIGPGAVELQATIVAGNTPDDCADDPSGTPAVPLVSLGHVLDSDGSCVRAATGDRTVADPGLAPLADNGGATATHALEPGSPAIDAAGDTCVVAADQRGIARPMDGDDDGSALCDIGALEVEGSASTTTTTTPTATTTTTIPGGCDGDRSFASILCRLDALAEATDASSALGNKQAKLARTVARARILTGSARDKCAAGDAKAEKKSGRDLRKAGRKLLGYRRGLSSNRARKQLPDDVRQTFLGMVEPLIADVKSLKKSVVCPDDAMSISRPLGRPTSRSSGGACASGRGPTRQPDERSMR